MCKLNSPDANYKVRTSKKKETTKQTNKIQNKAVYVAAVKVKLYLCLAN
jgi:hypothetical protein